jgi:hypothetical protein
MIRARWIWAALAAGTSAIATVVACSEGGHGTGHPLAKDPGALPTDDGDGGDTEDPDGGTSPGSKDSGGPDCGFLTGLKTTGGPYCTFMAGNTKKACEVGQHCCIYPQGQGDSTCNAIDAPCLPAVDAGGADFECDEPADCTGGKKCCFAGTATKDAVCSNKARFENFRGTYCAASCKTGDLLVCTEQKDCTGQTPCRSMNPKSKTVWACVP